MKSITSAVLVLFMLTVMTPQLASAQTNGPSSSGAYRFVLDDDFTKSVEFSATTDERGTTTGQMTFRDEAGFVEQDPDGEPREEEPRTEFFMTANLDSLTIEENRAVMGGTVTDSSNRSFIGQWVQLVVEDNGDDRERPDRLSWCFCQPEEGGWVPSDADMERDEGAYWKWWATDFEREDDRGIPSENIIPGNATSCPRFDLAAYEFAEVRIGEGQIHVRP